MQDRMRMFLNKELIGFLAREEHLDITKSLFPSIFANFFKSNCSILERDTLNINDTPDNTCR